MDAGFPLGCFRAAWQAHRVRWPAIAAGVMLAGAAHWMAGEYLQSAEPVESVIGSVAVVTTPGEIVNRDLMVTIRSPIPSGCVRMSQQLLYQTAPNGSRTFYPLGSALNGPAFGVNVVPGGEFQIALSLPSALAPGEYWFVHRSLYYCEWVFGVLARRIPFQTAPVRVVVR